MRLFRVIFTKTCQRRFIMVRVYRAQVIGVFVSVLDIASRSAPSPAVWLPGAARGRLAGLDRAALYGVVVI